LWKDEAMIGFGILRSGPSHKSYALFVARAAMAVSRLASEGDGFIEHPAWCTLVTLGARSMKSWRSVLQLLSPVGRILERWSYDFRRQRGRWGWECGCIGNGFYNRSPFWGLRYSCWLRPSPLDTLTPMWKPGSTISALKRYHCGSPISPSIRGSCGFRPWASVYGALTYICERVSGKANCPW
jgi:hypothetical protein